MDIQSLPQSLAEAVHPLFDRLPLDEAMPGLVVPMHANHELSPIVEEIVAQPVVAQHPTLVAGLWLYVDELDRSHTVSQGIDTPTGSYWHGIMHRREGDFSNSHYWFRKTGSHPAMSEVPGDYDGHAFVDEVAEAQRSGRGADDAVRKQRDEWQTLFRWCVAHTE